MDKWLEEEIKRPKKPHKRISKKTARFHSYKIGAKGNLTREELYRGR